MDWETCKNWLILIELGFWLIDYWDKYDFDRDFNFMDKYSSWNCVMLF